MRLADPVQDWQRYRIGPGVRSEHAVGYDFLVANGARSFWLVTLGRWACLPFTVLGAWVIYRWAKQLRGQDAGLCGLLLWCFSPNIVGHGQLMTPDVGVTALCVAACYAFWLWSETPNPWRALSAGIVLGLAVLAKTNAIVLVPALILGVVIHAAVDSRLRRWTIALQAGMVVLAAGYIVNLGYGFEASFRALGEYEFFSDTLTSDDGPNRFRYTPLADIPVPFPAAFVEGIDLQRYDFENTGHVRMSYFRGEWYDHGWWWYYFYAVAVKVPIATIGLVVLGTAVVAAGTGRGRVSYVSYVVIPGAALFGLACSQSGFSHSLRYALPAFPFMFLLAATSIANRPGRLRRSAVLIAMIWISISSLAAYPHSLSYFNEMAGGPDGGHYHLLDGNVDWGQDLLFICEWIDDHPETQPVYTAYWGFLPIEQMGIELVEPEVSQQGPLPPGHYIISVNHLHCEYRDPRPELGRFLSMQPEERLTPAVVLYHVE